MPSPKPTRADRRSLCADAWQNRASNPTDGERRLWRLLRSKQVANLRFRRQQPIGPYIADFFCPAAKLIVELDGDQHATDKNAAYDAGRTCWLEERGYKVLRFTNGEVLKAHVLETIWREAESRLPLPERPSAVRPSLKGRVD
jgi:very-short-patch-repair endonuclease